MDTGNYMANKMDDQITAGMMLQDEIIADAIEIYKTTRLRPSELLADRDKWFSAFRQSSDLDIKTLEISAKILEQRNELLEALKLCFRTIVRPVSRNNYNASHYDTYFKIEALIQKLS